MHRRHARLDPRLEVRDEVRARVEDLSTLEGPGTERYVALLASRVAAVARGSETVRIASADIKRLGAALPAALAALAPETRDLAFGEPTDRIAHGVELVGERTHVDLSLEAIVAERRDELSLEVAAILFGAGGSD